VNTGQLQRTLHSIEREGVGVRVMEGIGVREAEGAGVRLCEGTGVEVGEFDAEGSGRPIARTCRIMASTAS